jgi:hypothetical protein
LFSSTVTEKKQKILDLLGIIGFDTAERKLRFRNNTAGSSFFVDYLTRLNYMSSGVLTAGVSMFHILLP